MTNIFRINVRPLKNFNFFLQLLTGTMLLQQSGMAAQAPIDLGMAGNYAILAKSGISTVPASAITGDMGVSPNDSTAITGFSLILPASGAFSTSSQVTGKVYAPDYANPTPVNDVFSASESASERVMNE